MKANRILSVMFVGFVSACADLSSISKEADLIEGKKAQIEERFAGFQVSDRNFLDLKDNSLYPDGYWSLKIKTTYFNPVSIDEVLQQLSKEMNVSYFNKGVGERKKRMLRFEGTVDDYISYLSDAYDVFIDVDKNKIVRRDSKTKIYKIYNSRYLKNESKYAFGSSVVNNKGGGENGFSGSIEIGGVVDLWQEVDSFLDSMQEEDESFKYSIFRDFSQVSATGSRKELDRVALFVNEYNKLASTEIMISYKIVSINQEALKAFGADIQGGNSTINVKPSVSNGFGGQEVSSVLLGYATDGTSHGIGGSLTAQLLRNGAQIVNEGVAVSLNGKPVPVNSVDEVGYVSTITREPGSGDNAAAETIETDTLETGMSFMIVPEVLTDGRVNITMGYSRKRLNQLTSFGEEGDSVQLPDLSKNENINNLIVEKGKETVAAIFTEKETRRSDFTGLIGKSMSDLDSKSVVALIVKVDTKK